LRVQAVQRVLRELHLQVLQRERVLLLLRQELQPERAQQQAQRELPRRVLLQEQVQQRVLQQEQVQLQVLRVQPQQRVQRPVRALRVLLQEQVLRELQRVMLSLFHNLRRMRRLL
jgi:hypothetical protein